MLQAKPISPASGRQMSDPATEDAVPSAPAMTEESASRTAPPPAPGTGVGFLGGVEAGVGSASNQGGIWGW